MSVNIWSAPKALDFYLAFLVHFILHFTANTLFITLFCLLKHCHQRLFQLHLFLLFLLKNLLQNIFYVVLQVHSEMLYILRRDKRCITRRLELTLELLQPPVHANRGNLLPLPCLVSSRNVIPQEAKSLPILSLYDIGIGSLLPNVVEQVVGCPIGGGYHNCLWILWRRKHREHRRHKFISNSLG